MNDDVIAETDPKKTPIKFPTKRGTSEGVNVPPEIRRAFAPKSCLVKFTVKRGEDGIPYLVVERVQLK